MSAEWKDGELVCECGHSRFERKMPVRGIWYETVSFADGETEVTSTTDGLQSCKQPARMTCENCGKTAANPEYKKP